MHGAYRIVQERKGDGRGFFSRMFCKKVFEAHGLKGTWVQTNNSLTAQLGTVRGLHLQRPPMAECKLVRCIHGAIWDVIVDLRPNSETYGCWHGETLSSENRNMIYVPEGFAHGFISLTDDAEIIYPTTQYYSPDHELGLLWSDPSVGIKWPIPPMLISEKDQQAHTLQKIKSLIVDT